LRHIVIGLILVLALVMPVSAGTLKVTVHNPNDYDLTDYQVRIDLNGYLDSVGYLKVTDESGNDLKFCYEQANGECGINPSFIIWVKVPKIPANGNAVIYIEKAESNHAVNGDCVFDFYDDFNDGIWYNKWIRFGNNGVILEHNGILDISRDPGINDPTLASIKNINLKNKIIEYRFNQPLDNENKNVGLQVKSKRDPKILKDYRIYHFADITTTSDIYIDANSDGVYDFDTNYIQIIKNVWYVGCLIIEPNKIKTCVNIQCYEHNLVPPLWVKYYIILGGWNDNFTQPNRLHILFDWIRVRKYTDIEPTITIEKAKPPTPKPKLTLMIQTETELKEGETRYSKLILKNEGTAPAQNVVVTLFSQGLNIQTTENLGTLQPQESREIPFYVEAKYSGQYKIFAKAEYTDGLNKYIETAEQIITVKALPLPSNIPANQPEKGDVSITLRSDVVKAKVGQEFSVTLSVTNYIVNPDMTLQIILKPPSGLSITSTEFVQTGVGEYSAVYHVKSGESKAIKIFLKPNNAGEFVIRGEVIYYFGNDKENFKKLPISERIIVVSSEEELKQQTSSKQEQMINKTPGFEAVLFVIAMVLAVRRCKR